MKVTVIMYLHHKLQSNLANNSTEIIGGKIQHKYSGCKVLYIVVIGHDPYVHCRLDTLFHLFEEDPPKAITLEQIIPKVRGAYLVETETK